VSIKKIIRFIPCHTTRHFREAHLSSNSLPLCISWIWDISWPFRFCQPLRKWASNWRWVRQNFSFLPQTFLNAKCSGIKKKWNLDL